MKIPAYLQQNRYGICHFRRAIPHDLRAIIGKREITKSLQTRDPKTAIQLARFVAFQVEKLFCDIRKDMSKKAIWTGYSFEIDLFPDGRKKIKAEGTPEELETLSKMTPEQIAAFHTAQSEPCTNPKPRLFSEHHHHFRVDHSL